MPKKPMVTGRHFFLTLFRMGIFGALHVWGGAKKVTLPKMCHTYLAITKLDTVIPDLREIPKIYKSRDTSLKFCWYQYFLSGNQQILIYQIIQIVIAFWFITSDFLIFFWVFKDFFHKLVYNFDNISKNATLSLLKIKVFLVTTSLKKITTWLKLYCRYCGHVIKVW